MNKTYQHSLSGKIALVTGASRGLGLSIALELCKAGADVVATDLLIKNDSLGLKSASNNHVGAKSLSETKQGQNLSISERMRPMGQRSLSLKMDVSDPEEIQQVILKVEKEFGGIDILINNAGVMDNFAVLENQSRKMWERGIDVNLSGAFYCTQAVWKGMKKKRWGRIINISSFTANGGAYGQPGYGASKAGLVGLTRTLALEGAKYNITVNTVLPGFIETETVKRQNPKVLEKIINRVAMKRMARPEEIASVVAFLSSDATSYMTGATIPITGGADLFVF